MERKWWDTWPFETGTSHHSEWISSLLSIYCVQSIALDAQETAVNKAAVGLLSWSSRSGGDQTLLPQAGWVKWQTFVTHSSRSWKREIRVPAWSSSGEGPPSGLQPASHLPAACSDGGERNHLSLASSYQDPNPTPEGSTFVTYYLLKAPPQIPSP